MKDVLEDVVIIGAGPAGLCAAIYALRAGVSVTVCESNIYGGQAAIINKLENYPGFESISGAEFSSKIYEQVKKLGAKFVFNKIIKVDLQNKTKILYLDNNQILKSKTVIIANGLKRRVLNCPGENKFLGRGVSYCATCDGAFFKSKNVVIVGGGNTALEDALYLSNICNTVTLIHRRDKFRAENFLVNNIHKKQNIEVIFNSNIQEICGDQTVNQVIISKKISDNKFEKIFMDTDGVFIAVGYEPDCEIYRNQINMTEQGYFCADESCETNIPGVFVAGDCRTKFLRQIVTAVSDGAITGNKVAEYIFKT